MHVLIGLIIAATGDAVLMGAFWARVLGVVIASLSVVVNFLWLPYNPVRAVIVIAFDVFVIWVLTVNGQEIKNV